MLFGVLRNTSSTLLELSKSLSNIKDKNISYLRIVRLIKLFNDLPSIPKDSIQALNIIVKKDSKNTYELVSDVNEKNKYFMDDYSESIIISLCNYLIYSNGEHINKILPFLLRIFISLPFFNWNTISSQSEKFSYKFCSLLKEISNVVPSSETVISHTIMLLIRQTVLVLKSSSRCLGDVNTFNIALPLFQSRFVLLGLLRSIGDGECSTLFENDLYEDIDTLLTILCKPEESTEVDFNPSFLLPNSLFPSIFRSEFSSSLLLTIIRLFLTLPNAAAKDVAGSNIFSPIISTMSLFLHKSAHPNIPLIPTQLAIQVVRALGALSTPSFGFLNSVSSSGKESQYSGILWTIWNKCRKNAAGLPADHITTVCQACTASLSTTGARLCISDNRSAILNEYVAVLLESNIEDPIVEDMVLCLCSIFKSELNLKRDNFERTLARGYFSILVDKVYELSKNLPDDSKAESINLDNRIKFQSTLKNLKDVVLLIAKSVSLLQHPDVTRLIEPILLERYSAIIYLRSILIGPLSQIALWTENDIIFQEIVSLIISTLRKQIILLLKGDISEAVGILSDLLLTKPVDTTRTISISSSCVISACDSLFMLATLLPVHVERRIWLKQIIFKLFIDISSEIHEKIVSKMLSVKEISKCNIIIGLLLPTVAELANPAKSKSLIQHAVSLRYAELNNDQVELRDTVTVVNSFVTAPEGDRNWFRQIWFYLVIFQLVSNDVPKENISPAFSATWTECIRRIAAVSPTLIVAQNTEKDTFANISNSLTLELESDFASRLGASIELSSNLKKQLMELLPNHNSLAEPLSFAVVVYLLSLHHVESLRCLSGFYAASFDYLDDHLISGSSWYKIVRLIIDRNFDYFISTLSSKSHDLSAFSDDDYSSIKYTNQLQSFDSLRQQCLEEHTLFFLGKMSSRYPIIRSHATKYLHSIVDRFPYLMWNSNCLTFLLNLLQYLHFSVSMTTDSLCESSETEKSILFLQLPEYLSSIIIVDIPDERTNRLKTLGQMSQVAHVWLLQARSACVSITDETVELLQRCVHASHFQNYSDDHVGVSLALQLGVTNSLTKDETSHLLALSENADQKFSSLMSSARHIVKPSELPHFVYSRGSSIVNSFGVKERYLGELQGRYDAHLRYFNNVGEHFGESVLHRIQSEFNTVLSVHKKFQNQRNYRSLQVPTDILDKVESIIYQAVALFIWSLQNNASENDRIIDTQTLLHLICMIPAQIFSPNTMKAAIFAWDWILSSDQKFEVPLLNELRAAWIYTVQHRYGLFSGSDSANDCAPLESKKEDSVFSRQLPLPHYIPSDASLLCHTMLIKFLDNQFEVLSGRNEGCVLLLSLMMHTAMAEPQNIACSPSSFIVRFRLLNLAFKIVQRDIPQYRDNFNLLRDRIYNSACNWFTNAPIWYNSNSRHEIDADYTVLIQFSRALQLEALLCSQRSGEKNKNSAFGSELESVKRDFLRSSSLLDYEYDNTLSIRSEDAFLIKKSTIEAITPSNSSILNISPLHVSYATSRSYIPSISSIIVQMHNMLTSSVPKVSKSITKNSKFFTTSSRNRESGKPALSIADEATEFMTSLLTSDATQADQIVKSFTETVSLRAYSLEKFKKTINNIGKSKLAYSNDNNIALAASAIAISSTISIDGSTLSTADTITSTIKFEESFSWSSSELKRFSHIRLLLWLMLTHEIDRLVTWHNPTFIESKKFPQEELFSCDFLLDTLSKTFKTSQLIDDAWSVNPQLAFRFVQRFPISSADYRWDSLLESKIRAEPFSVYDFPQSLAFLLTPKNVMNDIPELHHLMYFKESSLPFAMSLLVEPFASHQLVNQFAIRSLQSHTTESVVFYMPQLVQSLRFDHFGLLEKFLLAAAKASCVLSHRLIWNCRTESFQDPEKGVYPPKDVITDIAQKLRMKVIDQMDSDELNFFNCEFKFFESITEISGILKPSMTKAEKKSRIVQEVSKIGVFDQLYLPTSPFWKVKSIILDSGIPLQSAAKVPILIAFTCEKSTNLPHRPPPVSFFHDQNSIDKNKTFIQSSTTFRQACIFKVNDDIRQDALSLQVIELIQLILQGVGVPLWLRPYRVIPDRSGSDNTIGGIIECVPRASSRDELGKAYGCSLKTLFINRYGPVESARFRQAQRNFILSLAGYSVATYFLQVKDRHNGNIMIDDDGHLLHVDFGFILETSPGGNMKFESADFKITLEMLELMGGASNDNDLFKWFLELIVKGFLAIRSHMEDIMSVVTLMAQSKLPCFRPNALINLRNRFMPTLDEKSAAKAILSVTMNACNKWTTNGYDGIQWLQQGIWYHNQDQARK